MKKQCPISSTFIILILNREALKVTPDYTNAMISLGITYAKMGKKDEALKTFNGAVEISPNDHELLNNIGNILYERGQYEGAAEQYLRSLQIKNDGNNDK
jgi:Tfp pilus assembly protein PilF